MFRRSHYNLVGLLLVLSCIPVFSQMPNTFEDLPALTSENFNGVVKETESFVMFYAPWCGHCKNLKPIWLELAQKYFSHSLTIATVDCTTQTALCSEENVRGYPTSMDNHQAHVNIFSDRLFNHVITERRCCVSKDFRMAEVKQDGAVQVLTEDNYQQMLSRGDVFLMLYAPWCGHCKNLKPVWEALAQIYNSQPDAKTVIAKTDCTQHGKICTEFDVAGYPTLLYVRDGRVLARYDGSRELEALQTFVASQSAVQPAMDQGDESGKIYHSSTQSTLRETVLTVTGSNFQEVISSNPVVFLKFYAPWCGHCKRLAPVWEKLGSEFEQQDLIIAKIDCTEHDHICKTQEVSGYPTLKLYKNGKVGAEYSGDRTLEDMKEFISSHRPKDEL